MKQTPLPRSYAIGLAESVELAVHRGCSSAMQVLCWIQAEWGSPYSPTITQVRRELALRKWKVLHDTTTSR